MDNSVKDYRNSHTFEERRDKFKKQLAKYPGKIFLIVEKKQDCQLPNLKSPKFMVDEKDKFMMVKNLIERKIRQADKAETKSKNSFFVFVKETFPNPEMIMKDVYNRYKDEDGFLYLKYGDQQAL